MAGRTVRRCPAKKTARKAASAPALPVPAAGERVWMLDVPHRVSAAGATWNKKLRCHVYVGRDLPASLAPFAAKPYSYQQWLADDFAGTQGPSATAAAKTPRPEQLAAGSAIADAARHGMRGMALFDDVGMGKTISAVLGAKEVLAQRGGTNVLVIVDRPTAITIPSWRSTIAAVGDGGYRWLICSPDQLKKLIAANGRPKFAFDVVIADEAQNFRHTSQRTDYMRRITKMLAPPDRAPFLIAVTATPGHHPGEWRYLSSLFAQIHGEDPAEWDDLGARLARAGLPLARRFGSWQWSPEALERVALQAEAVAVVRGWLTAHDPPLMLHRDSPWGPAPIDGLGVELTPTEQQQYDLEWGEFRREMGVARTGSDTARGLAALLRFRQKAGMIRVPHTVDLAAAYVARGYQVVIAAEMVSTAAAPTAEALEARGVPVARIFGGRTDAEEQRLRFQRGLAPVCVFTTTTAISLHANEQLSDGTSATATPRIGLFHQPRYSGIAARQTVGRAHRDYQVCPWFLLYSEGTVEERAATTMVQRLLVAAASVDGDLSTLGAIAELFGAEWLPSDALA
ncbi:DEAD/DEAH box helicase [Prescottella equi]|uniref:DEAD/DEAH box helicase family protein n=1 Tax=Rhodococcus hoagii TaxID=43767 RepID=UPI0009BE1730|nr:DEAD/DEAH box helicase family protein [Prescottella equi]OQQ34784.1 DEAD/DEAH box helicase [Prescottella equi]